MCSVLCLVLSVCHGCVLGGARAGMRCCVRCATSQVQASVSVRACLSTIVCSVTPRKSSAMFVFLFCRQVEVSFNDSDPLRPQEPVALTVSAEPGSYIGVLAVDRSVTLLRSGNDLSKQQVGHPFPRHCACVLTHCDVILSSRFWKTSLRTTPTTRTTTTTTTTDYFLKDADAAAPCACAGGRGSRAAARRAKCWTTRASTSSATRTSTRSTVSSQLCASDALHIDRAMTSQL